MTKKLSQESKKDILTVYAELYAQPTNNSEERYRSCRAFN